MKRENYEMLNSLLKLKQFTSSGLQKNLEDEEDERYKLMLEATIESHKAENTIIENILKTEVQDGT